MANRKQNIADSGQLLEAFWRRHSFHDMAIESVRRVSGRVNIVLDEYVLSLTRATRFTGQMDEFPDVWIDGTLDGRDGKLELSVVTELGSFLVDFADVRLIRRLDFAILIPEIDK